ncbi:carotenoid oxygenase family protein [Halioglobus maricola]|uniref:Carotenoid oxygenase family protein n=1 Tax=Halioglobus maricola TaxID=2601894 RepID=A0A5P9NHX0_9GAMM|nr:carotenoid oxygenase family protein [Halioglobus maricola]QFU75139.1 carotenoid oxygenase family protein [Halioglobus maricola]
MAEPMPTDNTFLNFPWAPIQMECEASDLVIEGEIPADLSGSLYRVGPNQRWKPRGDYHLFAGDGMVHAFHIDEGRVDYINRWVRTAKFNLEDVEGKALINALNPFDCDPDCAEFALTDKEGLANTAAVWHGDRLLIMEEGHQPYEIDPISLDSIGSWTYRGKLHTAMTAHPKVDPDTGEMVFFAYMATGPFSEDVMVHKVNADGILCQSIHIPTPYSAMVHDFAITENYIVVPIFPITGSLDRAMEGGPPFAWEPDKGVHVAVLPRDAESADDIRWLKMDACFVFHFMNAYDSDGVITIDAAQFPQAPLFPTPDGESTGETKSKLCRWTIDLNNPEAEVESVPMAEFELEFPQIDPRYAGKNYRHGWYTTTDGKVKSGMDVNSNLYNTIGYWDHESNTTVQFSCGNGMVSEALFVPRSEDAAEGEGYLLAVVTDFTTRLSGLWIFDALDISSGPMAKAHLSHRVPPGFHGTWRPSA